MVFWKEIERERKEKDASFEIQHFNDYGNADIRQLVVEPLNSILGKYQDLIIPNHKIG